MGMIIKNNKKIADNDNLSMSYLSLKAICDEEGDMIEKYYAKPVNVLLDNILMNLPEENNAGFHNSFFRGINVTSDFKSGVAWTEIKNGTFKNLFIGDDFVINNHTYTIVGFDIYYNNGDSAFTNHHVVCMPISEPLYGKAMNTTNTTSGGYANSNMFKTHIPAYNIQLSTDFGSHLCSHRELVSSEMNSSVANGPNPGAAGASSNWSWQSVQAVIPTEIELIGCTLGTSSGFDIGTGKVQLPYFRFCTHMPAEYVWTRSVFNSSKFVAISNNGQPFLIDAGVNDYSCPAMIPLFCITG